MLRSLKRAVLHYTHFALAEVAGGLGALRGVFHSSQQVVRAWPDGPVTLGSRVALFIHYDRRGAVRGHVLAYLRALRDAHLSIVFVTNSGTLRDEAMASLQELCAVVLVRRNIGYDFAAMREGLERLGLPRPDTELLVIANDSVYGPLRPLDEVLGKVDFATADLWGATESWQRRYHLQSFFLVAGRAAMTNPAWHAFWHGVRPVRSKHWVVSRYEVGLTQQLLSAGLRCAALWPYKDLVHRIRAPILADGSDSQEDPFMNVRRIHAGRIRYAIVERMPLNPTAELWRHLLEAGFPFIKRELLRDNPARVQDIADWRDVVGDAMPGDIEPIEQDLQRVLKDRSP